MAPTQSRWAKGSGESPRKTCPWKEGTERCRVAGCDDGGKAARKGVQAASGRQRRQRNRFSPKALGRNAECGSRQRDCSPVRSSLTSAYELQGHAFLLLRSLSVWSLVTSDLLRDLQKVIQPHPSCFSPEHAFFPKSEFLHVSVFCHFARLRISQSIKAQVRQGERPCPLSVCLCKKKPSVLLGDLSTQVHRV